MSNRKGCGPRALGSPIKCWDTHKKVGMQDSPSGLKDPDGSPKQVNDCEPKTPAKLTDKQYNKKNAKMRKDHDGPLSTQQTSGTGSARIAFAARFGGQGHSMTEDDGSPSGYAHALKKWGFNSPSEARSFANKNKANA